MKKSVEKSAPEFNDIDERAKQGILLLRDGDSSGMDKIVTLYEQRLMRYVGTIVGEQEAPDVMQEVWLYLARRVNQYDSTKPLTPWLYRMAYTRAIDYKRRLERYGRIINNSDFKRIEDKDDPEPEDNRWNANEFDRREIIATVRQAISQLPGDLAVTQLLLEWEGMSYKEAASAMGIARPTVGWRLATGRKRLEEILTEMNAEALL